MQENILELIEVFSNQGHSGTSASFAVNYFETLASWKPLSPITCKDDEWIECSMDKGTYQNKRLNSVFKDSKEGKPHYIRAIVWKDERGCTFTGGVHKKDGTRITSSQNIKLPFIPKTFYIDVVDIDDEHVIKDELKLDEVFKYYNES